MEPHSQGAGGAVGTSHSTVWGRCFSHRLLLGHGDWLQCGCRGGTRLGSAALRVPGYPRSSRGHLHQGFAYQHNLGKGSSSSCAREARGDGGTGAPTWHWLGLPAALFHPALRGMHGSTQPSPASTDTFLHPLSVLAARCRKRKAKQALPSRLVQSRVRSRMWNKQSWTRSRSGAVPGNADEKDGPRPLTGLNFAPCSRP